MYVGSLTRYYCGDWATVIQQSAGTAEFPTPSVHAPPGPEQEEIAGRQAEALAALHEIAKKLGGQVIGPGERPIVSDADRQRVQRDVVAWRDQLARRLNGRIAGTLRWDESPSAPYFTDKPGWEGYSALVLWASYDEHPQLQRPVVTTEGWTQDPAWQASAAEGFATRYGQLVHGPEIWLPEDFPITFDAEDLAGKSVTIGSSQTLQRELKLLNSRTWRANDATLDQWRFAGPDSSGSLEANARFAFAVFLSLCERSVAHRLPMKLDY